MSSNSETGDTSAQPCGNSTCSTLVVGNAKGIQCDFCKLWFHLSCTELDENSYQFLSETRFTSIVWKCASCPSLEDILTNEIPCQLSQFQKSIANKIEHIETNIAKKINLAYKVREPGPSEQTSIPETNHIPDNLTGVTSTANDEAQNSNPPNDQTPVVNFCDDTNDDTNGNTSPPQICGHYRKGICRHGASGKKVINNAVCKFLHPPKCRKYCKFDRDGCEGGCDMLHPILCKSSLKFRECFDEKCTLTHLLGTQRYSYQVNNYGRSKGSPSNDVTHAAEIGYNHRGKFQDGGFRYETPFRSSYRGHSETKQMHRGNGYAHVQNDFPRLRNSEESMNEMASAIKQMQTCVNFLMQNTTRPEHGIGMMSNQQHLNQYSNEYYSNNDQYNQPTFATNQHVQGAKNYNTQHREFPQ